MTVRNIASICNMEEPPALGSPGWTLLAPPLVRAFGDLRLE
ncbi:USP46 isoform 4 [Pongo abelii]|uniref:USP46 isoform 3 n=1 Tax=Pongo abelii TaxID=9601 RepID=A0A2J8SGJ1_PONAB|nr:USP46 isoform 3 [Pongo abelii]PNJ19884.1 USP46 isoform 4 [Pongo abelii]